MPEQNRKLRKRTGVVVASLLTCAALATATAAWMGSWPTGAYWLLIWVLFVAADDLAATRRRA